MSVELEPSSELAHCPRCGGELAADQRWCMACGHATATRILPTANWRVPIFFLATLVALAGAGLAIAFAALSNDSAHVVTTTAPAVAAAPAPVPTTSTPTAPAAGATTATSTAPITTAKVGSLTLPAGVLSWPANTSAWTVDFISTTSPTVATLKARSLHALGVKVGLLFGSDFRGVPSGAYVAFAGQYPSRRLALASIKALTPQAATGAAVVHVTPKKNAPPATPPAATTSTP